jgi:hypothetical protein
MSYFDEKKGIVLSKEDKQIFAECEPQRKRVFYFNGTVGEWRAYSERHKQDFEDFDLMNKIWK